MREGGENNSRVFRSSCCNSPVYIRGTAEDHYCVCCACGKPCDADFTEEENDT